MYNWSVDTRRLKRNKPEWIKWKLEQLINFGLRGTKLSREELSKYLPLLKIDSDKRAYLEHLIWDKP